MAKKIVITGLGVVSSNGIGKEAFCEAIFKGISGIKPISLFGSAPYKVKTAGEIKGFRPEDFLGAKGLRALDRSTSLILTAAFLALDDAKFQITENNSRATGVVIGTTLGSARSISEFDRDAIKEGPHYVVPAHFPNTVINSPASQVSIRFNIKGFNATISTGFTAGLDAVKYAADFIRLGRAEAVLAGGVEELCEQTFLAFYKSGLMAGISEEGIEESCPFDKRRNGIIFGEGAGILVMEDMESALSRKARIYAEVMGFGTAFEPYRIDKFPKGIGGLKRSMSAAMEKSGIAPEDIDYVCAGANSTIDGDRLEAWAISDVFGGYSAKTNVSSIKSMLGECFSASGALEAAASVCAIEKQKLPPNINYRQRDPECALNVITQCRPCGVNNVLVNSFGSGGNNASLVISRFQN